MIKLENVSKKYGDKSILSNISFKFEKGKSYYIKGSSGIGKTTLLNIIYGYEYIDEGKLEVSSKSIEYMFQDPLLFNNLSIEDNLKIKYCIVNDKKCINKKEQNEVINKEFKEALDKVNLNMSLDTKVNTLSGGEKQRLQLAQYIISKPDIILLDEPACKLDKENRKNIYELINNNFSGITKIIVTHDDEMTNTQGELLEIKEGKICVI